MHRTHGGRWAALILGASTAGLTCPLLTAPTAGATHLPPEPAAVSVADALTTTGADPAGQVVDPARWQTVANIAAAGVRAARDNGALADTVATLQSLAGCAARWSAQGTSARASLLSVCRTELAGLDYSIAPRLLAALTTDPGTPTAPGRHGPPASEPRTPPEEDDAPAAGTPDTAPGNESAAGQEDPGAEPASPTPPRPAQGGRWGGTGRSVAPTAGVITSTFGDGRGHGGIDIANTMGAPIVAVDDGEVISAGPAQGYGLWVRIRHDDGTVTTYGHNNANLVKVGQRVEAGQKIATVGDRGNSTGPHLHFEVEDRSGAKTDPAQWLADRGTPIIAAD
ncbi:peptidoglycan DD-metalloendopeptidase family protein [Rhodococcus sp. 14C212]|uniref:peptidoglycan DD-metalloendopeptidase family protein n=1 Tax=Rhodococcus sp. 14C212 TaxID=2711209 RepID=UPI0013EE2C2C|nr:peptidoglycan DD-metalloendopeptidase family protein [Rhodococcus sp. 14C212]NGP08736.1 peptidoglycan DD-metalloendopeptidase family protein [Rhodococcus sp. 14C212]